MDKQLQQVDAYALSNWKESITNILADQNIDMLTFTKILKYASIDTEKRFSMPGGENKNPFGESLLIATKVK